MIVDTVPYFGRLRQARVATLGINPSNREFVDGAGEELKGDRRRFPTLGSLGLRSWADASSLDITSIVSACETYFSANPYSRWFDTLDTLLQPAGASYYGTEDPAAHIDLVPYATDVKWAALRPNQQRALLHCGRDLLGCVLRDSRVELLVLNGTSVVRQFEAVAGVRLRSDQNSGWDLPHHRAPRVRGVAYSGELQYIREVDLGRSITVLGFNHNLQSSFGVTRRAVEAIAHWIATYR